MQYMSRQMIEENTEVCISFIWEDSNDDQHNMQQDIGEIWPPIFALTFRFFAHYIACSTRNRTANRIRYAYKCNKKKKKRELFSLRTIEYSSAFSIQKYPPLDNNGSKLLSIKQSIILSSILLLLCMQQIALKSGRTSELFDPILLSSISILLSVERKRESLVYLWAIVVGKHWIVKWRKTEENE